MNVHFINHNSISYTQWILVGISICVCVCSWHSVYWQCFVCTWISQTFSTTVWLPQGPQPTNWESLSQRKGRFQLKKYTPLTNSFIERKRHSNSWMILYTLPLFYSYQHYQNVDGHNTDNFPVYMVLIVGLLHNKISLWHKTLSSIFCVYISYYKLQVRILWRIT